MYLLDGSGDSEVINGQSCPTHSDTTDQPQLVLSDDGELMIIHGEVIYWSYRVISPLSENTALIKGSNARKCILKNPKFDPRFNNLDIRLVKFRHVQVSCSSS